MKKLFILPLLVFLISGCVEMGMSYQPSSDLRSKYKNSVKDENITIYYNEQSSESDVLLTMAVQNVGRIYMKNLTINYDDCCQSMSKGPGVYNHKNLGSLKHKSHKVITLKIPNKNVDTVKLQYSYTPVVEDSFMSQTDQPAVDSSAETINGMIILYIKK